VARDLYAVLEFWVVDIVVSGMGLWIGMGGWARNGPNGPREEGVSMWLMMLDALRRNNREDEKGF
jgi:hypothetical protein